MKISKIKGQYFIMIVGFILLILNIITFDFDEGRTIGFVLRITSNIFLILAMIFSIRQKNKEKPNA